MSRLSVADVQGLARDRSGDGRSAIATKVATAFADGTLGDAEREIAGSIFRILARDVEAAVRRTLADKLHDCPHLPHDVAKTLARDIIEVAEPVLRDSAVLCEADLIEIIRSRSAEHQMAIAGRPRVSETVADALVATGEKRVVGALLQNRGAAIAEATYGRVLDAFASDDAIQEALLERPPLPPEIVRRLVGVVADHLKGRLAASQEVPEDVAESLVLETREASVAKLLAPAPAERDVAGIVRDLARNDRLKAVIVIRALEIGDLDFFEHAIAARAHVPPENARRLLQAGGDEAIHALYRQARLPEEHYPLNRLRIEMAYGSHRTIGTEVEPARSEDFAAFYDRGWVEAAEKEKE